GDRPRPRPLAARVVVGRRGPPPGRGWSPRSGPHPSGDGEQGRRSIRRHPGRPGRHGGLRDRPGRRTGPPGGPLGRQRHRTLWRRCAARPGHSGGLRRWLSLTRRQPAARWPPCARRRGDDAGLGGDGRGGERRRLGRGVDLAPVRRGDPGPGAGSHHPRAAPRRAAVLRARHRGLSGVHGGRPPRLGGVRRRGGERAGADRGRRVRRPARGPLATAHPAGRPRSDHPRRRRRGL
ncbi:MAG: hypothetical protein AVDCRST_MAG72-973, partial [uncultured Nocardioidaceae bacterium]